MVGWWFRAFTNEKWFEITEQPMLNWFLRLPKQFQYMMTSSSLGFQSETPSNIGASSVVLHTVSFSKLHLNAPSPLRNKGLIFKGFLTMAHGPMVWNKKFTTNLSRPLGFTTLTGQRPAQGGWFSEKKTYFQKHTHTTQHTSFETHLNKHDNMLPQSLTNMFLMKPPKKEGGPLEMWHL